MIFVRFISVLTLVAIVGCNQSEKPALVKKGDTVLVKYDLKSLAGRRIDTSFHPNGDLPLRFVVGEKQVIAGLDSLVVGMKVNEKQQAVLPPNLAFGNHGVFYFREFPDTVFVIKPIDTLLIEVAILEIQ